MTSATCRPTTLRRRLDATLGSLEGLERYRGHFLNWYDTASLAPLHPRYVSTVDSGNLAGSLIALAQGLLEHRRAPADARRNGSPDSPTRQTCWRKHPRRAMPDPDRGEIVTEINRLARAIVSATRSPVAEDVVTAIQALGAQLADAAADTPSAGAVRTRDGDRVLVPGRARGRRATGGGAVGVHRLAADARQSCVRARRRHAVRLPVRPAAAHLLDRVPPRRRRRPRTARRRLLRSAGVGSAAGELRRHRQGRRPAAPLVSPWTSRHQRGRPRDADVLGRDDVRVPDAAAPDAELPGNAARSELPRQRPTPDRVRPPTRRAVGDLGVGVRVHRSRRATISTGRSACPGLDSSAAWPPSWSSPRTPRHWRAWSRRRLAAENFDAARGPGP